MKSLKSILAFTIPLIFVLIIFVIYSCMSNLVQTYKTNIIKDYAIIVVSKEPLSTTKLTTQINFDIKKLETLKREEILLKLKDNLTQNSLKVLQDKLPHFYKIHLYDYPTKTELNTIKENLKAIKSIKRIEAFSTDHSKIYSLLLINESIFKVLLFFILIFAVVVLTKQVNIWFFEHSKRISIIQYYGGSILYGAMPIIKLATISFITSSLFVIILTHLFMDNISLFATKEMIQIIPNNFETKINYIGIFTLSFVVSGISLLGVLIKHKTK